jgi:hypothetical protein
MSCIKHSHTEKGKEGEYCWVQYTSMIMFWKVNVKLNLNVHAISFST